MWMEKTTLIRIGSLIITAIGIYLTIIGLMILYLDYPMNVEKMMNRDGLIFILMGVSGILLSDMIRIKIALKKKIKGLENIVNELYGGSISLIQRTYELEKSVKNLSKDIQKEDKEF